jgi:hypothetical protein
MSSPSTMQAVQREYMKRRFEEGYEKGLKEAEAKIRANRAKAMGTFPKHTVVYKAKKMTVGEKADRMRAQWDGEPFDSPPVGILESGLPKPDEFTQLYNHDFHKLLANFDALLDN